MLIEMEESEKFGDAVDGLKKFGEENGLAIQAMHEDIFNSMHRI